MKTLLVLLFSCIGLLAQSRPVVLTWDYPLNLTNDNTLVFRVLQHTNVAAPMSQWTLLSNVPNYSLIATVQVSQPFNFFRLDASNYWGAGFYSNITNTPQSATNATLLAPKRGD